LLRFQTRRQRESVDKFHQQRSKFQKGILYKSMPEQEKNFLQDNLYML
jgi:hypothetical protein